MVCSLQVQCQYEGSALLHTDLWSLNPTNPPPVTALGTVRVQMRIATGTVVKQYGFHRPSKGCQIQTLQVYGIKSCHFTHCYTGRPPSSWPFSFFPDESFTSFLPEDQLPLTLYLRKAVYVEVSITPPSPDPSLSLRVRDCFAYPASRHSVWTLLYDG